MKNLALEKGTAVLVTDEAERLYFTGFHSTFGYLVLSDGPVFFTDARYFAAAKARITGAEVRLSSELAAVGEELAAQRIARLGLDETVTSVSLYRSVEALGLPLFDASAALADAMAVKSAEEISLIEASCRITQDSLYAALGAVREGIAERELAAEIEYQMKKRGATKTSFDLIVAFGENAAVPHHETGDRKLGKNECVLTDIGCVYRGYCSDMTRTVFYGEPTEEFSSAYEAVLGSALAAERNIRPGMTGVRADAFARDYLAERGLAAYFTHSLGHGVGVNIHEAPYLSPKRENILRDNMVFSIEPGVYLDGKFGIRIEDTVCLAGGKVRRLFTDDKKLMILK